MKMQSVVTVVGMKRSKGEMEGVAYDSTKFYIETSLDDSKGNAKGIATTEYTMGKSDEYDKYAHLPFPFVADAEIEIVTTGRVQKIVMHGLKPRDMKKPNAASGA